MVIMLVLRRLDFLLYLNVNSDGLRSDAIYIGLLENDLLPFFLYFGRFDSRPFDDLVLFAFLQDSLLLSENWLNSLVVAFVYCNLHFVLYIDDLRLFVCQQISQFLDIGSLHVQFQGPISLPPQVRHVHFPGYVSRRIERLPFPVHLVENLFYQSFPQKFFLQGSEFALVCSFEEGIYNSIFALEILFGKYNSQFVEIEFLFEKLKILEHLLDSLAIYFFVLGLVQEQLLSQHFQLLFVVQCLPGQVVEISQNLLLAIVINYFNVDNVPHYYLFSLATASEQVRVGEQVLALQHFGIEECILAECLPQAHEFQLSYINLTDRLQFTIHFQYYLMATQVKEEEKAALLLPPQLLSKAEEAFKTFEKQRDGYVMVKQLPLLFEMLGKKISQQEADSLVQGMAQQPQQGQIYGKRLTYPKFLSLLVQNSSNFVLKQELMQAFRVFDPQRKGVIPVLQFRFLMRTYGNKFSMEEAEQILKETQPQEEMVKYEKFIDKMLKQLGVM